MTVTRLFRSNRTQAVRLPREVAFPTDGEVSITVEGRARVLTPLDSSWDRFFDSVVEECSFPGRQQESPQDRDWR
ncbi:type II toxin-antitoxin system VapB family antitoxin [Ornithinimicrobium sp. Y1847]|uniref:type II toxin-antitoxin system VapB family antitoxin n=1 Tax=unclassified Ornithinimicrobium TaxID=2615080 RepID=UPI003B670FF4